jgi:hypothetical protein
VWKKNVPHGVRLSAVVLYVLKEMIVSETSVIVTNLDDGKYILNIFVFSSSI